MEVEHLSENKFFLYHDCITCNVKNMIYVIVSEHMPSILQYTCKGKDCGVVNEPDYNLHRLWYIIKGSDRDFSDTIFTATRTKEQAEEGYRKFKEEVKG